MTRPALHTGAIFDVAERAVLVLLATGVALRLAPSFHAQPANAVVLVSETLAVGFILFRRPAARADQSAYAALIALVGTAGPLLVAAASPPLIAPVFGFALTMAGLIFNIAAKIALNRSFGLAAANRGVKRSGPYRLLRHPMYAGYVTTQIGFLLMNPSLWNAAVYGLAWSAQLLRIRAEEKLLLEDPAYRDYAAAVRFRLIPGVF